MSDIDDLGAPENPGESMGFSSRGKARPVGEPSGGFAVNLGRVNNPVVRDTFAPEIRRRERAEASRMVQVERANVAAGRDAERAAKVATDAARKSQLSKIETDFRAKGVKFFTDAEGNIRPQTDEGGRTLYNETSWRKAGDAKAGFWQEKRDGLGKTVRRKPKLKPGVDATDPNLYYDFGDEGDEVAGHVDDLAGVKDPEVAAVVSKVRAQRAGEMRKASLAPLAKAREDAETELQRRQREALALGDEAAGIQARMAEIEANPEYGQKAGGVFGIGAAPTEAAGRLTKQREQLNGELERLQARQVEVSALADKDGELARRAQSAKLDHEIWESESQAANYDDLAEARRAALKRDGKPESGDPVLDAITKKQEELGVTRSRSFAERQRIGTLAAQAEAKAAADTAPVTPGAVEAGIKNFEAELKAFEADAANGVDDPARRDALVTRQGTLRGQVARLNAEAVQGMKDFEAFADGVVADREAYRANSQRWGYGKDFVTGSLSRQADRFDKAGEALKGRGTWTEGFGNTVNAFGGLVFGTWADIATGVSSDGLERKRRAEEAWELVGNFSGKDARRALSARVAAEEAVTKDPAAQLVAVLSLKEKPFTEAERLKLSSGVIDLQTMQRAVNRLRESDGGLGSDINVGSEETLRTVAGLLNVVPGVSLEKMGAPKDPEGFAKWKVLRGELAKLMAEKFRGAEVTGAVAGSIGQFMLTRKAAGALAAKGAAANAAGVGGRLAAVVANAERNANWLTYGTVGTAQSFTENPESLGFFNRFASAGMNSLGLGAGEGIGNKLEALVGKVAKVKCGYGNLAAREAAGLAGGVAGEFSSDMIESAVLNQDFSTQVPVAFWGNLGAVVGMRLFGAAGRVKGQRDYNRFAETAAAAKNEAFNRWADVKAFMATPEGKRVAELLPMHVAEGGDGLARAVFASDAEGREAEVPDAFKALSRDFGLTVGFGEFVQGAQARISRSRAALAEIETLPDFTQPDPTTGAPVVVEATRNTHRDAARALVRVANGVPVDELTEAEAQSIQLIGVEIGSEVFRDIGGAPVITDKASSWLRDRSPAAASLIGASEAEMMARAKESAAETTSPATIEKEVAGATTREATDGAGSAPNIGSGDEVGGSPAPVSSGAAVEFTDARGTAQSVAVPAGAVVPSSGAPVRDAATAQRWLAETRGESVRGVRFYGEGAKQAAVSKQPAGADRAAVPAGEGSAQPASVLTGLLNQAQTASVMRAAMASRKVSEEQREPLARRVLVARQRLAQAAERWRPAFPGGVRVIERAQGSGGMFYDASTESLVVSLADVANQLEVLTENSGRIDALVTEEAIHRAAVELENAGKWSARELWTGLAPTTQATIRKLYDPTGKGGLSDWQLGHELVRMLVQGRLKVGSRGAISIDGELVSEATASAGWLAQVRDALSALVEYLRDLAGRLRAEGNSAKAVVAVENAVSLVEARIKQLSGVRVENEPVVNAPKRGEASVTSPAASPVTLAGQSRPAEPTTDENQNQEASPQGRQEGLLTQTAPDLPAEGEALGGAQAGDTGPRARLVVGADGERVSDRRVPDPLPGEAGGDGLGTARALSRERETAAILRRRADYLALPPEAQNYRIMGDDIAPRGQVGKLRANLAALRLLRTLEAETRAATPAEKDTLARFVGWGDLSQVFDENKGRSVEAGDLAALREEVAQADAEATRYAHYGSTYYKERADKVRERLTALENWEKQYGAAYRDLKEMLTPEEWERAMRSTINAHYTSPTVIRAMWSALQRMGFKGGKVTEPAGGVGHFFGAMPEALMQGSTLAGVELDSITGRIFQRLYPTANIEVTGFQDARIPDSSQDVVISNVPFAQTGPADPSLGADAPRFNLHNYFFAKALRKVRPGGVVAFITTHHTMDSAANQRRWLERHGELIGALRLPKTAFKANAGTEVVTDVIFLRRPDGKAPPFYNEAWGEVAEVGRETVNDVPTPIVVNEYFARHPEMVLGRNSLTGSMYRDNEYTVEPTGDLAAQLADAVERLPEGILDASPTRNDEAASAARYADRSRKQGNFVEEDGRLFTVDRGELKPVETLPAFAPVEGNEPADRATRTRREKMKRRVRSWLPLRDHYKSHLALMLDPASTDAAIEASRERLNLLYDQVRAVDAGKYWFISPAFSALRSDPDFYLTLGLEVEVKSPDSTATTYRKADVFTRRTITPPSAPSRASSPADAVRVAQAWSRRPTTSSTAARPATTRMRCVSSSCPRQTRRPSPTTRRSRSRA